MSEAPAGPDVAALTVGVLGGTGPQGKGLAYRLARAGQRVLVGSRDAERGRTAAEEINGMLDGSGTLLEGFDNARAAKEADLVIVAVPWEGHAATLQLLREQLAGKVVVDCVNPLGFDKQGCYLLPVPEGSAAQQAATLLPDSQVVAAFHHVSATVLVDASTDKVDTDVLVLGDDRVATDLVQALADRIPGVRGIYGGRLRNAGQVEGLTANLVSVNRRYKAHAGIRVTDV